MFASSEFAFIDGSVKTWCSTGLSTAAHTTGLSTSGSARGM